MTRGTTPTHTFTTDIDLSGADEIYVTYKQGNKTVCEYTLENGVTATEDTVVVTLSQADTLAANPNHSLFVQIRAAFPNGTRVASNIIQLNVGTVLKEGEI